MKKILLIVLAGLFLGACAQKTCPTYAAVDLEQGQNDITEQTI